LPHIRGKRQGFYLDEMKFSQGAACTWINFTLNSCIEQV